MFELLIVNGLDINFILDPLSIIIANDCLTQILIDIDNDNRELMTDTENLGRRGKWQLESQSPS